MASPALAAAVGTEAILRRQLYLLFRIGADRYALAAGEICEILSWRTLKRVPAAPDWVAGTLEYRGQIVPVLDMSALAGAGPASVLTSTRVALVHYRAQASEREEILGLILEQATETKHYDPAAFQPYGLDNAGARYLGPVLSDAGGMVQKVMVSELLTEEAHRLLFPVAHSSVTAGQQV